MDISTSFYASNENYIFDPRSSGATKGFAVGLNSSGLPMFYNSGVLTPPSATVVVLNEWSHVVWMKNPGVNTLISYVNGVPSGDIAIPATTEGDKFKTNTDFPMITIGKLHDYATTNFIFNGKIGGLRVSNTSIYSASFSFPPIY